MFVGLSSLFLLACGSGPTRAPTAPDADGDGYTADDCDDTNPAVNPGASEVCDAIDDDCDGRVDVDATDAVRWFADDDGDGYGNAQASHLGCDGAGLVDNGDDCDDHDAAVHPDADETCNRTDDDCDGRTDEDPVDGRTWYADGDGDGYGDPESTLAACQRPDGYAEAGTDCDDADGRAHPGVAEVCGDGIDNDCSGDAAGCEIGGVESVAEAPVAITGADAGDYLGGSVAGGGDLDADGYDDIVVGAWGWSASDTSALVGRVYVFRGPLGRSDALTTADVTLSGITAEDWFGFSSAMLGDVDGDGYGDFAVGAPRRDPGGIEDAGVAYLFSGVPASGTAATAVANFASDGQSDYGGYAIAGAGDTNDDGFADLLVSAPGHAEGSHVGCGLVALFEGGGIEGDLSLARDGDSAMIGDDEGDYLGTSVASGDFDGDGFSDFLVSAYAADAGGHPAGAVYVELGPPPPGRIRASMADYRLNGSESGARFGWAVAGLGDVNGDGRDDIGVGADMADTAGTDAGAAYIYIGGSSYTTPDATLTGGTAYDYAGRALQRGGDINADGYGDVLLGAPGYDYAASSAVGAAYVFYGPVASGVVSGADAIRYGQTAGDAIGAALSTAGDMDGDGYADFLVGSAGADPGGMSAAGAVWLFYTEE
jgi:hypothetical protein